MQPLTHLTCSSIASTLSFMPPPAASTKWSNHRYSVTFNLVMLVLTLGCCGLPTVSGQSLAMTDSYNCYITPETSLQCFGLDPTTGLDGQDAYSIPSDLVGFVQIVAGSNHTCGLLSSGEVHCFGDNSYGQSALSPGLGYTYIAAGGSTTCGILANGTVICVGVNTNVYSNFPFGFVNTFKHIAVGPLLSAGYNGVCGVTSNGTLQCAPGNSYVPSTYPLPTSDQFIQVTVNEYVVCGLLASGFIECTGGFPNIPSATLCATSLSNGSPYAESCAVTCAGSVVCWSSPVVVTFSQLVNSSNLIFSEVMVGGLDQGTDSPFVCALDQYGRMQCESRVNIGRYLNTKAVMDIDVNCVTFTNGDITCYSQNGAILSLPPSDTLSQFKVASTGRQSPCAINSTQQLQCWNMNPYYPLPAYFYQLPIIDFDITGGDSCILLLNGTINCWTPTNSSTVDSLLPQIAYQQIELLQGGICALSTDHIIFCGGADPSTGVAWPSQPFGITTFKEISPVGSNIDVVCGIDLSNYGHCFKFHLGDTWNANSLAVPSSLSQTIFSELVVYLSRRNGPIACGLDTVEESVHCWGGFKSNPPIRINLIGPFHHLAPLDDSIGGTGICLVTLTDNSLQCLDASWSFGLPPLLPSTVGALAPQYHYRVGTAVLPCPFLTLSNRMGSLSSICDGICAPTDPGCLLGCPSQYYCQPPDETLCPPGTYCTANTYGSPPQCPFGYYGNSTGLQTSSCSGPCPPGFLCNNGTVNYLDAPCPPGYYCPDSPTLTPVYCPIGRFGLGGSTNSNCSGICPPGIFCSAGTVDYSTQPCPAAYYCPIYGTLVPIRCPPGSYCSLGSSQPLPCDAGSYGPNGDYMTSTCEGLCPPGYLCPNGTISYTQYPCPAGQYCPIEGTVVASVCLAGYMCPPLSTSGHQLPCGSSSAYCPAGSATSKPISNGFYGTNSSDGTTSTFSAEAPCDAGHYCDGSGLMKICLPGAYQPNTTSTSCMLCPGGSYSGVAETSCHFCQAGTFTPDASQPCLNCTAGKYSLDSASLCTLCPLGRFSDIEGLGHLCQECTNGTYADQEGMLKCSSCLPPYYNPTPSVCLYCSDTVSSDSRSCTSSICPKNTQFRALDHTCPKCPLGQYSLPGSSCQPCPLNTYTPHIGYDCISCQQTGMAGLVCVDGLANVTAGYWAYREYDPTSGTDIFYTVECPTGFCSGGALQALESTNGSSTTGGLELDQQSIQCQYPRLQSADNYLCGACADGYLLWNNECHICEKSNGGLVFLSLLLSFGLVLFLLRSGSSDSSSVSGGLVVILIYFIQIGALEVTNISKYLNWYTIMNFHLQSLSGSGSSSTCIAPIQPTEQVVLELLTPIILIIELGVIGLIHGLLHRYHSRIIAQPPADANAHQSNANHHQVKKVIHGVISSFDFNRYIGGVLSILLFCYTLVAESCISWFSCITINGDTRVLFRFPNISCSSSEYQSMLGGVIFVFLIYIIGLPISMVVLLRLKRKFIEGPKQIQPAHSQIQSDDDNSVIAASLDRADFRSDSSITSEHSYPLEQLVFVRRFGCLFRMYHSSAWYWQSVVLSRRLLLVTIHVILLRLPSYRFLCFSLVNLFSLVIIIHVRPFRSRSVNLMDVVSHISLIIISQLLSLLPPYPTTVQVGILLLLILPMATLILGLIQQYRSRGSRPQPIEPKNQELSVMSEMVEIDGGSIQSQPLSVVVGADSQLPNGLTHNPLHSPTISGLNPPPARSPSAIDGSRSPSAQQASNDEVYEHESVDVTL